MAIRDFDGVSPNIDPTAFIDETALVIGHVSLAEDVSVWPMSVIRGDVNSITIGARSNIQDGTIIHVNHAYDGNPNGDKVVLGEEVIIGHQVVLHGCTIQNNVLIGLGARVMDNVIIEENVMVGANSLVPQNKILESGYLYLGSPVKKIRKLTDKELAYLPYSANFYAELKNKYKR